MPRRNFQVDAEGVVWHAFESGSEDDDEEGVDEGIEDMLRRMRVGDMLRRMREDAHARFVMMSCNLVVVPPEALRMWGRRRLKRWFDLWRAARLRRWQHP